ncbi:FUSC family protein [Neptunitalea lumnitzerae]|uniref:Membrane protein n=1 Tax=Neptunitalea lumnitzerae TaxID=2965509 RepID=A0ABQ5MLK6_9FLAO|nr:FUSC family membrane protein [Neptunitalea sp. Y10]GLB49955.1 membrane protein [Neptunitalea sp. Y10]
MKQELLLFLKTYDFRKGILFATLGFLLVAIGFTLFPNTPFGITLGMGILLSAISDVPGTKKHTYIGILTGIGLAIVSFCSVHLTKHNPWLLGTVISILIFTNSYICVYGLRASMVSFSGLLAIALGFVPLSPEIELYKSAFFILIGSGVYISVSFIINLISPKQIGEQLLVECMQLTASYLKTRASLPLSNNRDPLLKKLLTLQIRINEKHESLRAIVLRQQSKVMGSGYHRRQLLIFIELVDILELALATPINYKDIDKRFKDHSEVLQPFGTLLNTSSELLVDLSFKISNKKISHKTSELRAILSKIHEAIENYKQTLEATKERRDNVILLRNLADYEEQQIQKLETIESILSNDFNLHEAEDPDQPTKFITNQDYSLRALRDNFNFKSVAFKHALRLMLCVITGFVIGTVFEFQNAYWIIITILVIMRPNYGITKQRTFQRIIGTFIGALFSYLIIYSTPNIYLYAVITFIAMIFAFAYIQRDYLKAAIAITVNIIFVFAMVSDDAFGIINSRIIDTIVGSLLAVIFNYFFYPAWESSNLHRVLQGSLKANQKYLKEIASIYVNKKQPITKYKLSRKTAFMQLGNLHAAFQRMSQEPKSKQVKTKQLYDIIIIQHTFLSAAAALGTYIQSHKTTEASDYFEDYINAIINILEACVMGLNKQETQLDEALENIKKADTYLSDIYNKLFSQREKEFLQGQVTISESLRENLKEIKLVYDQLKYLYKLSVKLEKQVIIFSNQS